MLGDTSSNSDVDADTETKMPAAITDIGCEREINEDRYAVIDSPLGRAWVVCDGMGGELGGELAAQLAIDAIRRALESGDFDSLQDAAQNAIQEANRVIVLRRQNPAFSAMGTTTVAAIVSENEVVIANAGDSRVYLIRGNQIQQLTTDHTYVQDLVERGVISPEEALTHPQAHVLTRCLGASPMLEIDIDTFWLWETEPGQKDDYLLLCSDGLYSHVSDEEIVQTVAERGPQDACVQLTELAKERGGYDNITMVVLPVDGQVKEENPGKLRAQPKRKKVSREAAVASGPKLSAKTKVAILFFLGVLGFVTALLLILLQLTG